MGPLYRFGWFDFAYSLQLAGLIGFFFGFLLERSGFGDARKLAAVFYLKDFAVLKVMLTAIVVCMLGLLYFSLFGWLDLGQVHLLPTYILPQVAGGLVLGIGFVMGGYCPTTSIVAMVSGKLDALVFIVGIILGSWVFAELFPPIEGFYKAGAMGAVRLSDVLNIPSGLVALFICLMAIGLFWVAEIVEQRNQEGQPLPVGSKWIKRTAAAMLILLGLILAIADPDRMAAEKARALPVQPAAKKEAIETVGPKANQPALPRFEIVEDEGC